MSKLNEAQLRAVFGGSDVNEAMRLLSEHSPSVSDAALLERIRSAALRVSSGGLTELRQALVLANTDWRDLLVAAGFADELDAHLYWVRDEP